MEKWKDSTIQEIQDKMAQENINSTSELKVILQQVQKLIKQDAIDDYQIMIQLQELRDNINLPRQKIEINQLLTKDETESNALKQHDCFTYKDLVALLQQQTLKTLEYAKMIKKQRTDIIQAILLDFQLAIDQNAVPQEKTKEVKKALETYKTYL